MSYGLYHWKLNVSKLKTLDDVLLILSALELAWDSPPENIEQFLELRNKQTGELWPQDKKP